MTHDRPEQFFLKGIPARDSRDGAPAERATISETARLLGVSRRTVQRHIKAKCWLKDDQGLVILDWLQDSIHDPCKDARGCKPGTKRPQKILRLRKSGEEFDSTKGQIKALARIKKVLSKLSLDDELFIIEHIRSIASPAATQVMSHARQSRKN